MPDIYYVAGPMRNYPELNFPAFAKRASELRAEDKIVISPHELGGEGDKSKTWDWYLRRDLRLLTNCTHIVMLDGWEKSDGANLEHDVAVRLGMMVIYPDGTTFQKAVPPMEPKGIDGKTGDLLAGVLKTGDVVPVVPLFPGDPT